MVIPTSAYPSASGVIRDRDKQLWGKISRDTQCLKGCSTK